MRISRNNLLTSLTLVLGLILSNVSLAQSVEFGQDATGDPNVVRINGGASGFLYSDRLVFTAAHNFDGSESWSNLGFVNAPGELANFDDLNSFYKHLEQVLEHIDYFDAKKPQSLLMRRLRRLFGRSMPEKEEVAILRGILNKINPLGITG